MPGFLSSSFAQSTKEAAPAPKTLEERLLDAGVTEEGAHHFSEVITNGGDFVFDARKEAHFPHRNIAINALDCLLKAADGKTFKSFILVSLNNKICSEDPSKITVTRKMPDGTLVKQKAEQFFLLFKIKVSDIKIPSPIFHRQWYHSSIRFSKINYDDFTSFSF